MANYRKVSKEYGGSMTKKHSIISFLFLTTLLLATTAYSLERFDIITTKEMKQMLVDREDGKTDFILVNALDEVIFRHFSIPGSINIPWWRTHELAYKLGDDKSKLIVPY